MVIAGGQTHEGKHAVTDRDLPAYTREYLERAERLIVASRDPDWIAEWEEATKLDRVSGPGRTFERAITFGNFQQREWIRPKRTQPNAQTRTTPVKAPRARYRPIGANVRAERARAGLRLADLAERSGISRGILSRVELGVRDLRFEEAMRLAAALDITIDRFAPRA